MNIYSLLALLFLINGYLCLENPYTILGIDKKASLQEVKKAYKQLAKEWHPDKTDHADAEKKFIEIKQAYELLSDPERRKAYDLYGITHEDYQRQRPDYSQYQRFSSDPFEDIFGHHQFFQNQDINFYHKLSITTKYYESNVLPKSKNQPYILFFYSDWCFACIRAAGTFKKIIESFENVGITFATVNAGHEQQLVRKCSINSLPGLVMILDEHAYVFKEHSFTLQKIADFVRQKLPYKLIPQINDNTLDGFLSGWHDNRVRALVFEPRQQPRLRYLLTAFNFKNLVHFGFIQTMKPECKNVIERYKINQNLDTLLLFNEDSLRPLASISMSDIPLETLHNIIKANKYLALPRLSSQHMLDGICPMEWHRSKKRLCVILITENSANHDYARQVVRRIAIESTYSERVKFAYIYREKQKEFINALSSVNHGDDNILKIVVIWRRDARHVKFEWIPDAKLEETSSVENDEENYNQTKRKIDETVQKLLRSTEALAFEAEVLVSKKKI